MRRVVPLVLALSLAACAPPHAPSLPSGDGAPVSDFASAYTDATRGCTDIRTFSAVLAMSGKAGRTKLRGRLEAGFSAPASMRLEGIAPFGKPIFVLTAADEHGTLVLTRDNRVLRDSPAASIVDALVGVPLGAAAMRTIVDGCGTMGGTAPTAGRGYANGWTAVEFPDHVVYLQRVSDRWRVAAAAQGSLSVFYSDFDEQRATTIRLVVQNGGRVTADITLRLSQPDVNAAIDASAFTADVPADADPITLEDLRRAGPMGEAGSSGAIELR
ncbi:MAG TPA: hypothetical protein VL484_05835 [Vicinamibacterales bacterium]|jgi:outer membrane lipoprotein-sorting protein|nr:hypothetical protein [Vicinamibacterales bacterium]